MASPERFTDGRLDYGVIETQRSYGKKTGEVFQVVGWMFFNYMNIRQSDQELTEGTDQVIDLKVKTRYINNVSKNSHKVQIENEVTSEKETYDIYMVDFDKDKRYLFWYLSKVGRNDS